MQSDPKEFDLCLSSVNSPWKLLFSVFHSIASTSSHVPNQDVFHLLESLQQTTTDPNAFGNFNGGNSQQTPTKKKNRPVKLSLNELVLLSRFINIISSEIEISGQSAMIGFNSSGMHSSLNFSKGTHFIE